MSEANPSWDATACRWCERTIDKDPSIVIEYPSPYTGPPQGIHRRVSVYCSVNCAQSDLGRIGQAMRLYGMQTHERLQQVQRGTGRKFENVTVEAS